MAGFCCVALALALSYPVGSRWVTVALVVIGVSISGYGACSGREQVHSHDWIWFPVSGALGGLIILLVLFAPGVLNNRWSMDDTAPAPDPNELSVVPRDDPMQKGRVGSADEFVDAATEAFRQANVVIRVVSVRIGHLPGKGETQYLIVQLRIVNSGQGLSVSLAGFTEHPPVVTDDAGRPIAFIEQRLKQIRNRTEVFDEWSGQQAVEIGSRGAQDVLLVFDPPGVNSVLFSVDSAAWGRSGVCRFRIANIRPSNS